MVQRWREALGQVANLSGWDIQNKQESIEIEKIVKRVRSKLSCNLLSVDGLVGMQSRVEQLENLINFNSNNDVRVIGVCGMGGIGKSTLARVVYARNLHQFGAHCFVDDISKVIHGSDLLSLQKQLICQITSGEIRDMFNRYEANSLIKTMLRFQKALIVLDNADEVEQVQKLGVTRDCLCPGSRVVIISRDQHVLNSFGLDETYNLQLLSENEAHQLFCRKAFKNNIIMGCDDISREYKKLTDLALQYAHGLPLAIEVLGSFLCGRDISEWRNALARLKDNPKKEIADVLQISFDGLEYLEKEIFLDIACFFFLAKEHEVIKVLDYRGFHPKIGISVLVDKSLITIDHGTIEMHDLLKELGRGIVRQSAPNEPWKWSRIWHKKYFKSIMLENMIMNDVKAVILKNSYEERNLTIRAEVFSRMRRLELLIIEDEDMNFSGSLNSISNELRYFKWKDYPFTYFPSNCKLSRLFELVLQGSNIKQLWEGTMCLHNLKKLDLSDSENLVKTPDLSEAPNLEWLILRGCTKLKHIHPSTGDLTKLVLLDLSECTSLMSFPITVFGISSLRSVYLRGCLRLFGGKELENGSERSIQWSTLPFHFFNSSSSRYNDVFRLWRRSLARLSCLGWLDLSDCNLHSIPEAIASLQCLRILILKGNNIVRVPDFINKLPRLRELRLDNCKGLMYLDEFPLPLPAPEPATIVNRSDLRMFNCSKLVEREKLSEMSISWMREYIKVHKEFSVILDIVIPGSGGGIPRWFKHQSEGKHNSMRIEAFPNVNDNNWNGIALCAEIVTQHNPSTPSTLQFEQQIRLYFYNLTGGVCLCRVANTGERDGVRGELVHLCLFYFSRQLFIKYGMPHDLDESRFEIQSPGYVRLEVKKWGMRVVLNQDLE